jgi:hypothetical protein
MEVGLVQVERVSRMEVGPFAGIDVVFRMDPEFGFIETIERRII